ncbi:hypothetical protein OROMI_013666 [Orobanche minor]
MDNSYEFHSNGNLNDTGLQIIRHPSFQISSRFSLHWFDVRVFYVRIANFAVDNSTPEYLTLNHIPVGSGTILEVNGKRCSVDSEGISCILRRDRVDKKLEEATFVSTDGVRFTGSVRFKVFLNRDDELVTSGVLELSDTTNGCVGESNNVAQKWTMSCESVVNGGMGFLKREKEMGSESLLPTTEVYVAGFFLGSPIILTTSQVNHRKKHRKGMLDTIPENDGSESREDYASGHDLQVAEYMNYKPESEEDYDNLYWRHTDYIEGEDGELSWFTAGVRVGVGIGLGICLGIGIGAGLLVRTYQTTSRVNKRRLG